MVRKRLAFINKTKTSLNPGFFHCQRHKLVFINTKEFTVEHKFVILNNFWVKDTAGFNKILSFQMEKPSYESYK